MFGENFGREGPVSGTDFDNMTTRYIDTLGYSLQYLVIDEEILSEGFFGPDAICIEDFSVIHENFNY